MVDRILPRIHHNQPDRCRLDQNHSVRHQPVM
jgi:hypothetical protein